MAAMYSFRCNRTKLKSTKTNTNKATLKLAYEISNHAMQGAPVDTGLLINSIRVTDDHNNTIYVLAGGKFSGKNVPYARVRELTNNLHPDKKEYMKKAFDWGSENYKKYYKGVTK